MTKEDFLQYLIKTYQLPKDADKNSLYGFFQGFRPNTDDLEKVFSTLPNGEKYLSRLRPIFGPQPNHENGAVDMYFIVREPQASTDEEIISLGKDYLARLIELSGLIKDQQLSEYLMSINDVTIGTEEKYEVATEWFDILYNVILDWIIDQMDFDDPIRILDEAYYSIACNYWLANYFKWPQFEGKGFPDVFEPYFLLWSKGYDCYFMEKMFVLSRK